MFETIRLILTILPLIIELVKKLEVEFPESGLGKMKASLILETIKAVAGGENLQVIQKVIDTVVSVLNSFGVFKK